MPPPKRKCRLRGSRLRRGWWSASLSAGQRRRSSTGYDLGSFTIVLADSSSALRPCNYVVRRNTHFNRSSVRSRGELEQSFAKHLALGDRLERLPVFFQRICGVDMNAEHAGLRPFHQLGHVLAMGFRFAPDEFAPIDAPDVAALQQRDIERWTGDFARGEANHQKPPFPGERTQGRFGKRAANRIVDDVDTLWRELLETRAHVIARGVDRLSCAIAAGEGELFL